MKHSHSPLMVVFPLVLSVLGHAQLDKIVIPAGTPEDQALTAISNEQDTQKKLAMYQDFLQNSREMRRLWPMATGNFRKLTRRPETYRKLSSAATRPWLDLRTTSTFWSR